MRLNKTQKNQIVEDYARHVYLPKIHEKVKEINTALEDVIKKELPPLEKAFKSQAFKTLSQVTKVPVVDTFLIMVAGNYSQDMNNEQRKVCNVLSKFLRAGDSNLFKFGLGPEKNLCKKLHTLMFDVKEGYRTYNKDVYYKLENKIVEPLNGFPEFTLEHFSDTSEYDFSQVIKVALEIYELAFEADKHLSEVSQIVHSVTTVNKLTELMPNMSQFVPAPKQSTALVPAGVINQINENLKS